MIETMFSYCRFVRLDQSNVSFMFLYATMDRASTLSNVHLAALTGDFVYAWCFQSWWVLCQWHVAGYFPGWYSDTLDIVFGQHSADSAICGLCIWQVCCGNGFVFSLGSSCSWLDGSLYLLVAVTVLFKDMGEESEFLTHVFKQ